jgi:hypothetical protein
MPQVVVQGPFDVLELPNQHRIQTAALPHLVCREALALASASLFRQFDDGQQEHRLGEDGFGFGASTVLV